MLNGKALKIAFLAIVFTLCFLLVTLTIGAAFFHLAISDYMHLLGVLGIMGLFSGVVQAYIHANIADKSVSDVSETEKANSAQITDTTKEATK